MLKSMQYFATVSLILQTFLQIDTLNAASLSIARYEKSTNAVDYSKCGFTNATTPNLIVNGAETEPEDWPWMVYITHSNTFCGGTLIDETHVLTAAHCVAANIATMRIRLGQYYRYPTSSTIHRRVSKATLHPHYKVLWDLPDQPSLHDIAIITLSQPVRFSHKIRPICLPDEEMADEGKTVFNIGYGSVGNYNSEMIRILSGPVWSNSACQQRHDRAPVLDSHLCAGEIGTASCFGDSGSALMIEEHNRWYLIGIVGWGRETCDENACDKESCENNQCTQTICDTAYPSVHARISYYLPWIKKNLPKKWNQL